MEDRPFGEVIDALEALLDELRDELAIEGPSGAASPRPGARGTKTREPQDGEAALLEGAEVDSPGRDLIGPEEGADDLGRLALGDQDRAVVLDRE